MKSTNIRIELEQPAWLSKCILLDSVNSSIALNTIIISNIRNQYIFTSSCISIS